ncbi:helix-turn-helix domain-containing protein [Nitrincola iocasae]|uniref:Helix-turn-helix transcriptional regulator n=1 Tax=Nitrincola iocasae TaxID=2614693 RepID=A0A5J6LCS5_9GAMM|nr:helix-turn-helix transcriptional regulator [Nitrincola iocasae]QEW06310.1 helix-turn-helix transcriptional regulator [Nitrincola iocasae]
MNTKQRRQAVVFPKEQKILQQLGENIYLAMKRRKITQTMIAERTGLSKPTLRNIERGVATVSIGHYLRVLAVLGLAEDLAQVALDDAMGRKLQDIELLQASASGSRHTSDKSLQVKTNQPAHSPLSNSSQHIQSLMELAKSRSKDQKLRKQSKHDKDPEPMQNRDKK